MGYYYCMTNLLYSLISFSIFIAFELIALMFFCQKVIFGVEFNGNHPIHGTLIMNISLRTQKKWSEGSCLQFIGKFLRALLIFLGVQVMINVNLDHA